MPTLGNSPKLPDEIFIGRDDEMALLKGALQDAHAGRGSVVLVTGDIGAGKTRLARELSAVSSQACQVYWGRCYDDYAPPAYWPWVEIVRAYIADHENDETITGWNLIRSYSEGFDQMEMAFELGEGASDIAKIVQDVSRALPDARPLPALEPDRARFRLINSIITFLKKLASRQTTVIVLDNLHWADASSLQVLRVLAEHLEDDRILVLGTYRRPKPGAGRRLDETLAALYRLPVCRQITVKPFSAAEIKTLISTIWGKDAPLELAHELLKRTDGNPLFAVELCLLVLQNDARSTAVLLSDIPEKIREVIRARLHKLSGQCGDLLATCAVLGRQFSFRHLRAAADAPDEEIFTATEEAFGAAILEEADPTENTIQFHHGLTRDVILEGLSFVKKARIHYGILQTLASLSEDTASRDAGVLAYHALGARSLIPAPELVRYCKNAGEEAIERYAYDDAALLFMEALKAKGHQSDDGDAADLHFYLAKAQLHGQIGDPFDNLYSAFDIYTLLGDNSMVVAVACYPDPHFFSGVRLLRLLERALCLTDPGSASAGKVQRRIATCIHRHSGDYQAAATAFERALEIGNATGDATLTFNTLADWSRVAWNAYSLDTCISKAEEALSVAPEIDDPLYLSTVLSTYSSALLSRGDTTNAEEILLRYLAIAEELGDKSRSAWAYHGLFQVNSATGSWAKARMASDRGLVVDPQNPCIVADRLYLKCETESIGSFSDNLDSLAGVLEGVLAAPQTPVDEISFVALTIARVALITGDAASYPEILGALDAVEQTSRTSHRIAVEMWMARGIMAALKGDVNAAKSAYQFLSRIGDKKPPYLLISRDRCLGVMAQAAGMPDQAALHFQAAMDFCRRSGYIPELGWSCVGLVELNGKSADQVLSEATTIAREFDMIALQGRINLISVPSHGLTPRELDVLRLVARGMTNQEIGYALHISEKTVAAHVGAILSKTQSANRAEATAFAGRQGILDE